MVATSNFQFISQSKLGDIVQLQFPEKTQFINNAFAYGEIFPAEC